MGWTQGVDSLRDGRYGQQESPTHVAGLDGLRGRGCPAVLISISHNRRSPSHYRWMPRGIFASVRYIGYDGRASHRGEARQPVSHHRHRPYHCLGIERRGHHRLLPRFAGDATRPPPAQPRRPRPDPPLFRHRRRPHSDGVHRRPALQPPRPARRRRLGPPPLFQSRPQEIPGRDGRARRYRQTV